ncbi:MAG: hypothetical protein NZM11_06335 [Anaerolineales bacterium]|nr:hypothetical protein [Anaerolineales bacterium]
MSDKHYEWARAEERALARYVQPEDLPDEFGWPRYINRLDLLQAEGPRGVAEQLYNVLRKRNLQYDLAPFHPRSTVAQLIRKPRTILDENTGTCLDLAVLFATMCLSCDLLPLLVIVEGHAFAGLSLTRTRLDNKKPPKALAWDRGKLDKLDILQSLIGQEYVFVECTGVAQSRSLVATFPEGRGRDGNGMFSFDRACEAGGEQLLQHARLVSDPAAPDKRAFLYALDIHDLQVHQGFEPVKEEAKGATTMSQKTEKNTGISIKSGRDTKIGGDVVQGDKVTTTTHTGDHISVGDITGSSGIAIGRGAQATVSSGPSAAELAKAFAEIYKQIEARPPDPNVDKEELKEDVRRIEQEVAKGDAANPSKVERWLKGLAKMAPDIFEVTAAALTGPLAAVSTVIRKVVEKAKTSTG